MLIGLVIFTMLGISPRASAELKQSVDSRVTVVPARFEISGAAGETIKEAIKVTNEDSEPNILAVSKENFGVAGEDGEVSLGQVLPGYPSDLAGWIKFDKNGLIFKAKETKILPFTIRIPKKVQPGGRYGALVLTMDRLHRKKGEVSGGVTVVTLLMLTVAGDMTENASVESFKLDKEDGQFKLLVHNKGVDHIKPKGSIIINNIWGTKVDELFFEGENVLPGVSRMTEIDWEKPNKPMFGWYSAVLVSDYGREEDKYLSSTTRFVKIPRSVSFILFLMIVALLVGSKQIRGKILQKFNTSTEDQNE